MNKITYSILCVTYSRSYLYINFYSNPSSRFSMKEQTNKHTYVQTNFRTDNSSTNINIQVIK